MNPILKSYRAFFTIRSKKTVSFESEIKNRQVKSGYRASAPQKTKSLIDQIDTILATHYGFTPEELDFIINYDIKYRMGLGGGSAEEDEK